MKELLTLVGLSTLLLPASVFGQSITIDKLDKHDLAQAKKEVAFSTLLEGTVNDPNLQVFVFAYQPHLKAWRIFPATVAVKPETKDQYRWRAICQFGKLNGLGVGDNHQVRAIAFDRSELANGPPKDPMASKIKTEVIVLKRVK